MTDSARISWLTIAAVASPIILILTIALDIGGDRQRLETVIMEVGMIREEMRERTRDRIHMSTHDQDIEILRRDLAAIRSRITRNETWIFGDEEKRVSP